MATDFDSGDEGRPAMTASELRKANKPLMEKRRRARINESLNMLKSLVLDALKRDTSRYSKLEKADILEMTVKHLRNVQRQQMTAAMATDATVMDKYRTGYQECANEVSRYLATIDGLESTVRNRLMSHMMECVHKVASVQTAQGVQNMPNLHTLQGMQSVQGVANAQSQGTGVYNYTQPVQVQIPTSTQLVSLPGMDRNPVLMVPYQYLPYPTPSPTGSRSSSPRSPSPGSPMTSPYMDINHNDVTGCYSNQNLRNSQDRKQRAFHPYRESPSPKNLSKNSQPMANHAVKTESMWRPW